ncbi:MAG: hypothetical protein ACRDP7_47370 [Trebonia sp.]
MQVPVRQPGAEPERHDAGQQQPARGVLDVGRPAQIGRAAR